MDVGTSTNRYPGLYLNGLWLQEMGFISGALVQAIPEQGRMTFTLCNENIQSYSELDASTQKLGGKLIQVYYRCGRKTPLPCLVTSGEYLYNTGFGFGDKLIARYSTGFIRIRKLPPVTKIIYVTSVKLKYTDKPLPEIRLIGNWLSEFGFTPNFLVASTSVPGSVTFRLHIDDGIESYNELVKNARQNKMKLLKVCEVSKRKAHYPSIKINGSCVDKAGFNFGDMLLVFCEHGLITLQKPDFEKLGF